MLILAIDTTGFSSSIALVKDDKKVLFNKISSGFVPKKNWWDFPYFLPQRHQKFLLNNLGKIFKETQIRWKDINVIAVSANSGIYNCILVGLSVAETLAYCYKKPLIKVDHILAHIYSTWLERGLKNFQFPILVFSASGSHSDFSLINRPEKCEILFDKIPLEDRGGVKAFIGVGKLFDKIGRRLGIINFTDPNHQESLKKLIQTMSLGNSHRFDFSQYYSGPVLDLDFTNLINSVDEFLNKREKKSPKLSQKFVQDVAASFQESITEILASKIIKVAEMKNAKEVHVAGGISENKHLERKLKERIKKEKLPFVLRYPVKREYRLDNAAMIGALAYYQQKHKIKFINFKPNITK